MGFEVSLKINVTDGIYKELFFTRSLNLYISFFYKKLPTNTIKPHKTKDSSATNSCLYSFQSKVYGIDQQIVACKKFNWGSIPIFCFPETGETELLHSNAY